MEEGGTVDCVEPEDHLAYHPSVSVGQQEVAGGGAQDWYLVIVR